MDHMNLTTVVPVYDPEAELQSCDDDVREQCRRIGYYMAGLPTQLQLVKELRLLRDELSRHHGVGASGQFSDTVR